MDALQLLGSLLGNNPTSSRNGDQVLTQLIRGLTGGSSSGVTSSPQQGGVDMASLLGGLAMTALQTFAQRGTPQTQSPLSGLGGLLGGLGNATHGSGLGGTSSFTTPKPAPDSAGTTDFGAAGAHRQALTLVRAMINAAKADGHIDEQERQNILGRLSGVGQSELQFVRQELTQPLSMDFLEAVEPGQARDIYLVSLMTINLDTAAELQYMQHLAQRLGLDPRTVSAIHQSLGLDSYAV
ncbi:MAG: tellurite resistance TerB family protein [Gammaproteobacteria bacterium]|nr:tellurite resistance TerB family protein [Gammaproteobacteria bacterium]MCP5425823.1 tellurite resistance TerB family protein [Gammaproteobacteria bacterium]MCP5458566.1 tellurite resistance TerB family protein [Gammaproteobacteria bacterium]